MLAAATVGILMVGPVIVGFIPVMVVGALIFMLGIELMQEALVDTWGKLHRLEYLTVSSVKYPRESILTPTGNYHCCDDGSMGFCHWNYRRDYFGMREFCGANISQISHPSHLLWRCYGINGSTTTDPTAILERSWTADTHNQTRKLSFLRHDCQCRKHHARVD